MSELGVETLNSTAAQPIVMVRIIQLRRGVSHNPPIGGCHASQQLHKFAANNHPAHCHGPLRVHSPDTGIPKT
ncbi:hypothetical protein JQ596_30980 [Bradyrhizobium manausense]|uniref:hypothetical protein n=1 Tax=Bradyrhizobium TaxID=374 RepID=UPI001BAC2416|nr:MULTISPECIES: hypothetical protein [Bradyrhizobium]MBR0829962.1 hypothetical protein [Bradyrhizobium manausense]UVO27701.1 hypothetical protein KUF59_35320 [Bradyrhizobium arachidis]